MIVPLYLLLAPRPASVPADLRDAVSDGALTELKTSAGVTGDAPAAPEVTGPWQQFSGTKAIHGKDDRVDYYEVPASLRPLADSVVSFWRSGDVKIKDGVAALDTVTFKKLGICQGQKFLEQPAGAFCSGALVGPDLVMTAGHCVPNETECADTKLVFGYVVKATGAYPDSVPAADVYSCKRILRRKYSDSSPLDMLSGGRGNDYALLLLDRPVTGRRPLPVNRSGNIRKGEKVFIIGYPFGLPLKLADNARVRDISPRNFFWTDLDTFGGNSGSPVFNSRTGLIEGIHVRAETKMFMDTPAGCRIPAVFPQEGGAGAAANRISELAPYIP